MGLKKSIIFKKSKKITPNLVNKMLHVYNGKKFQEIVFTSNMVGYKIGEFIPTRKKFTFKKLK